jgi:hypothetical protein
MTTGKCTALEGGKMVYFVYPQYVYSLYWNRSSEKVERKSTENQELGPYFRSMRLIGVVIILE